MTGAIKVELLYIDDCPHHEPLALVLRSLLDEAGRDEHIVQRRIVDERQAIRERFLGSPTVRINGQDVDPSAAAQIDYGLQCRLYVTDAGLQGMPSTEWIRTGLAQAAAHRPPSGLKVETLGAATTSSA